MTAPILVFSQNILTITSEQLKTTNLIFLEHKKFSEQIPLLNEQIINLEKSNKSWQRTDSLRLSQIDYCLDEINKRDNSIEKLNKSLKINRDIIRYGTIGAGVLLCLLIIK